MSDHLSPHERAMLDALQRSDTPDSTEQRRVKQRLFAELGLGVAGAATATAASQVSHAAAATTSSGGAVSTGAAVASGAGAGSNVGAAATLGAGTTSTAAAGGFTSGLLAKLGAAKLALGLGAVLTTAGGTAVWWSSQSASPLAGSSAAGSSAAVSSAAGMQSSPNAPPVLVNPATLPEGPVVEAASKVDGTRPRGAESSTPPGRPTLKSSLEEEAQLLATAQQRISQGDPRGALSVLSQHAKQFPRGALSLERQATVAIAHCLSGQTARGRGEAERFRRKHPNSPMVKRLESACKLDSP